MIPIKYPEVGNDFLWVIDILQVTTCGVGF